MKVQKYSMTQAIGSAQIVEHMLPPPQKIVQPLGHCSIVQLLPTQSIVQFPFGQFM